MEKKIALVTGGSGGIGYEIIKRLVSDDYFVVFTYAQSSDKAKLIEAEFPDTRAVQYIADTNYQDVLQIIMDIKEQYGRLDALVNNLGQTKDQLLVKMTTEDFVDIMNNNLVTVFNFSKAALKVMSRQKFGKIVNMSSVVGVSGNIGQANYAASKSAMYGLTKSLSKEYAKKQITVNSISPGFIKTPMTEKLSDSIKEHMINNIDMKRFGEPKEVAGVVSFLLSDDADYITGQNIIVDGGLI